MEHMTKSEFEAEVSTCLKEIDPKYFNPNFNLMKEIVNVFGDIDFEKVKIDIERLNKTNEKLDDVIKVIVDKHSDNFFKILGHVREMKKTLDLSKNKYTYAQVSLGSLNEAINNLITEGNSEWKLRSIYCSEIVTKLTKTKEIYEILQDCDIYIQYNKLYEAIMLINNNNENYFNFDKEFRHFDILGNIHLRKRKIDETISSRLLESMIRIVFFGDEMILEKKISSLILYFINDYSKISIDTEVSKPLQKMAKIIANAVQYRLEEELGLKFNSLNINSNGGSGNSNLDVLEIDSEKKRSSLVYLIKCLSKFSETKIILINFQSQLIESLSHLLENTIKIVHDQLKGIDNILAKYFLETKSEKIKFLLFIQVPLVLLYHSLIKSNIIMNQMPKSVRLDITKINSAYEQGICNLLTLFNKASAISKYDEYSLTNHDFYNVESIYKHKINDLPFVNIEYLPIVYKLYYQFRLLTNESFQIPFNSMNIILKKYTDQLYQYHSNRISTKRYFNIGSFMSDYDNDTNNFKFINDLTEKQEELKRLLIFAFDSSYNEIMKILKGLYLGYYNDIKEFITKIKRDCVHNKLFESLYDIYINKHPNKIKDVLLSLQYRKYQKNIIKGNIEDIADVNNINKSLVSFVVDIVKTVKQNESLYLLTRNSKLVELITKLIASTQSVVLSSENFVIDLMKQEFTSNKVTALLEQVGQIEFNNIANEASANDISTLILISMANYDKISYEIFKLVLLCKIEFVSLLISLARNMSKTSYWLNEPQMTPEYYVTSFVNNFNSYNILFQHNLSAMEYEFITEDYLLIINDIFINLISNLNTNAINNFGVNLLIRNFEYIKDKLGGSYAFKENFTETIYYFVNYIRLLTLNEEKIEEEIKNYRNKADFSNDFIAPLLKIRTNINHTLNEGANKIFK